MEVLAESDVLDALYREASTRRHTADRKQVFLNSTILRSAYQMLDHARHRANSNV